MRARWVTLAVVAAAGVAAAVALAADASMGAWDTGVLVTWALGSAAVAAVVAALLLRLLRHARLGVQASIAALAPVLAVTVALVGAATTMFISAHDLRALLVVTVGAGTVGLVTALALGERVAGASQRLGDLAQRIGDDGARGPVWAKVPRGGTSELVRLAGELEATLARLAETRERAAAAEDSRRQLVAYRGDAARTPGDGGAGLGLAVARGLVEAHHGEISIRNEDQGCRFTIRLPLAGS